MLQKIRKTGAVAFDKVTGIAAGPDGQRFLAFLPIIKAIDDRIDKLQPEDWPAGNAQLGDAPSPFLEQLLTEKDREKISGYLSRYYLQEADVWQVCNLLAMQLAEMKTLAIATREQERARPNELSARKALVAAHEHLSILAFTAASTNPRELAPMLRAYARKNGADNLEKTREKVEQRKVKLFGKDLNVREVGAMQQAIDDANDFVVDLRTEVEHGRITANRHVFALKERKLEPKDYLEECLKSWPCRDKIAAGEPIKKSDLGMMGPIILEDLAKHEKMIKIFAKGSALVGIDHTGTYFPTTSEDHHLTATNEELRGTLTWTQRAGNLFKGPVKGVRQ